MLKIKLQLLMIEFRNHKKELDESVILNSQHLRSKSFLRQIKLHTYY